MMKGASPMTLPEKMRLGCCYLALGAILGCWNGKLALFRDGTAPETVYPCNLSALPPDAREKLENGIPIRSDLELAHILEDYLS